MTQLLAHQGGWDEFLMFVGPIALAYFVIRRLEKRAEAAQDQKESDTQNSVP
jgi:preprotein translocase subunit YajC